MITGMPQSILTAALIVFFYIMDTIFIRKFDQVREGDGSGRSYSYTVIVIGMALILVFQPLLVPQLGLIVSGGWGLIIQGLGLVAIIGALGLHIWARRHLRQFYAERVEIQPHHQLIESGPYISIRHPVITSFFLFATGLVMINLSIPSVFVAAFTYWDFSRAAQAEEELLSSTLPGYRAYITRTNAFFPSVSGLFRGDRRDS